MQPGRPLLLLGVCSLLILSGCGSSSYSSSRGTIDLTTGGGGTTGGAKPPGNPVGGIPGPSGSNNAVVATVSGSVSVAVGAKQTVSVTFTSSDGSTISGFGISGSLATLPAGWSGPGSFSCASVSTGSGCVLNLTYAPTVVGSGTLTIGYVFIDNSTMPNTDGSLNIAYAATAHDNVIAAATPTGEINALPGTGSQSVGVTFTTDDGNAATNLTVTTDLAALPAGWSSTAAAGFSCVIVSTGSGCLLPLAFAPTAQARGTLTVNFSYTDNSGGSRSGVLNIPYSTSSQNTVIATASPSGEVNAVEKTGGQAVAVTFTTDDGKSAANLYVTSNLAALPTGWHSASPGFSCAAVSSGNGCQLHLTYVPAALTSGTLVLNYAYTNAAGIPKTGSLNVAYAATTNDNAVATASPSGQVTAVAPAGVQVVTLTFTTDDGRAATALQITSGLGSLPAGWSSTATFSCNGFSTGNACQLPLTYAPATAGSGTLVLGYTYTNNAGQSKSGSASIAYRATTDDNVIATAPTSLAVVTGSITPASVTFTTDDGNLAGGLTVTSGLGGALPAGWSSPSGSFACATVSTGGTCQLTLTYAPTAVDSGTVSLTYGYNDNSGTAKTGSVSILYAATPAHLYVAEISVPPAPLAGTVLYCPLNGDGTLASCSATATDNPALVAPTGIAFYGSSFSYVADYASSLVFVCGVAADGSLSGCASTGTNFQNPWQLAVVGSTLYASNAIGTGGVTVCSIVPGTGALTGCLQSSGGAGTLGIAANANFAYVGIDAFDVEVCAVGLTGCGLAGSAFTGADGISLSNGYAYIANQGNGTVGVCAINADGTFAPCANSAVGGAPSDVVINGNLAYVSDSSGNIYLCTVGAGGALGSCAVSNGGTAFESTVQLAIH